MGGICAFLPFEKKEELDFFTHLEMFLRIESQPLAGRDHVMFRSSYAPVKDVIDGDLCVGSGAVNPQLRSTCLFLTLAYLGANSACMCREVCREVLVTRAGSTDLAYASRRLAQCGSKHGWQRGD